MEQASSSLFQLIAETQAKSIHLFGGKDGPGDHFRGKCFATKYSPVKVCDRHLFLFSFDWFFFWFLHSLLHGLHKCTRTHARACARKHTEVCTDACTDACTVCLFTDRHVHTHTRAHTHISCEHSSFLY